MDYFENIVKTILESEGYWARQLFKIDLSPEQKRRIGKPTMPRPEIDLLAFKPNDNIVVAMEVKSYLNSAGVRLAALKKEHATPTGNLKLFTCANYRKIVFGKLKQDLIESGMADKKTTIQLGLAAGKVYQKREDEIQQLFKKKGWVFWSPTKIRDAVHDFANDKYENDPAYITAKILKPLWNQDSQ